MSSPPPLPAATEVPAASPPAPLKDFGDWLSPMIVKELRQGLRTWIFVGAFIVLQAILVMMLIISFTSGNEESTAYLFWMLVAGILVFIVPLRGFNALAGEMKTETLDLLMLTRLDAFRIALGKWAALVAQSTLIAITVLPYVVLRYFGGGVDVTLEIFALVLIWLLSAAVTAVAVAFSALPSVIMRTLVLLGTWFVSMMSCGSITAIVISSRGLGGGFGPFGLSSSGAPPILLILAVLVPLWAFGCYYVLDIGASAIAPLASNHATRKRLIALFMMLAALGFIVALPAGHNGRGVALTCLIVVAAIATFDCLTETPTTSPSVYAPFVRCGALGRIGALFLSPGWATGLLFYTLVVALISIGLHLEEALDSESETLAYFNALLAPITPLALALLIFRRSLKLLAPYIVCALCILIASLLFLFMAGVSNQNEVAVIGVVTPLSALMLAATPNSQDTTNSILTGGLLSGGLFLLILVFKASRSFVAMNEAMKSASENLAKPKSEETAPGSEGGTF